MFLPGTAVLLYWYYLDTEKEPLVSKQPVRWWWLEGKRGRKDRKEERNLHQTTWWSVQQGELRARHIADQISRIYGQFGQEKFQRRQWVQEQFGQLFIKLCCLFCRCPWAVSWGCTGGYAGAKAALIKKRWNLCSFIHELCIAWDTVLASISPANDLQIGDLFDAEIIDISKLLYLWDLCLAEGEVWQAEAPVSLKRQGCSLGCKPPNALFTVNLNFPSHETSVTASKTLVDSVMVCSQWFFPTLFYAFPFFNPVTFSYVSFSILFL